MYPLFNYNHGDDPRPAFGQYNHPSRPLSEKDALQSEFLNQTIQNVDTAQSNMAHGFAPGAMVNNPDDFLEDPHGTGIPVRKPKPKEPSVLPPRKKRHDRNTIIGDNTLLEEHDLGDYRVIFTASPSGHISGHVTFRDKNSPDGFRTEHYSPQHRKLLKGGTYKEVGAGESNPTYEYLVEKWRKMDHEEAFFTSPKAGGGGHRMRPSVSLTPVPQSSQSGPSHVNPSHHGTGMGAPSHPDAGQMPQSTPPLNQPAKQPSTNPQKMEQLDSNFHGSYQAAGSMPMMFTGMGTSNVDLSGIGSPTSRLPNQHSINHQPPPSDSGPPINAKSNNWPSDLWGDPGGFEKPAWIDDQPPTHPAPPTRVPMAPSDPSLTPPSTQPAPIRTADVDPPATQDIDSVPIAKLGREVEEMERELLKRHREFIDTYGKTPRFQRPPSAATEEAELRRRDVELQGKKRELERLRRELQGISNEADPAGPPPPPPGMRASPMGYIPDQGVYTDPRLSGQGQHPHLTGLFQNTPYEEVPQGLSGYYGYESPPSGELSAPNKPGHGYGAASGRDQVEGAMNEATQAVDDIGVPGVGADAGLLQRIRANRQKRKKERQQRRGR
tara:strand:- start:4228 stop:6048 length:1821 start_codon:yes stop_codon:yes gene_type:complete